MKNVTGTEMQAITVKYHPQVGVKGARISARCRRGVTYIDYPHHLPRDARYDAAVKALLTRFVEEDARRGEPPEVNPWNADFICGETHQGTRVYLLVPKQR